MVRDKKCYLHVCPLDVIILATSRLLKGAPLNLGSGSSADPLCPYLSQKYNEPISLLLDYPILASFLTPLNISSISKMALFFFF